MSKRKGLTAQFIRLLVVTGAGCMLLFMVLRVVVLAALETYAQQTDLRQKETVRLLEDFQSYVTEEQMAASDVEGITR